MKDVAILRTNKGQIFTFRALVIFMDVRDNSYNYINIKANKPSGTG